MHNARTLPIHLERRISQQIRDIEQADLLPELQNRVRVDTFVCTQLQIDRSSPDVYQGIPPARVGILHFMAGYSLCSGWSRLFVSNNSRA